MARVLYFDCFSGISGDMVLGALIDAGLPVEAVREALGSLAVPGIEIGARRVLRAGVSATKFVVGGAATEAAVGTDVHGLEHQHDHSHDHSHSHSLGHSHSHAAEHEHGHSHAKDPSGPDHAHGPHRSLPEICRLIDRSSLPPHSRDRAKGLFRRLAEVEAAIHQMPVEKVHLHEVGALDSIIDIVGGVFALDWVGADRIVSSPLNVGGGMVRSAHGLFPVPAPATVKLLGVAPVYGGAVQRELVTPTGALIVTAYAQEFGAIPSMSVERVGYGAGDNDFASTPNVLRVLIGQATDRPTVERASVIECEIDDMNPQLFGVVMERLYAAGALDVFYVPVQMKKNRPGTLVTVIAHPGQVAALTDVLFRETTTIGLRRHDVERECLERDSIVIQTSLGAVRMKLARRDGRIVNAAPEFDDCARLALVHNVSVKDVQALAVQAYGNQQDSRS